MDFKLISSYKPAGDQPYAIDALIKGVRRGERYQTLLGVTGSGKTYCMANVIEAVQKPTLIIAHNKTLAAQLCSELRTFFPHNAVEYFVSYYDYYQPEAYIVKSDTYIDKEAQVNEEIDRLRHSATQALLMRRDVIIVASVSCIYSIGSPQEYLRGSLHIARTQTLTRSILLRQLVNMRFIRTTADVLRGQFRMIGDVVEIHPVHQEFLYRITLSEERVASIEVIDTIERKVQEEHDEAIIFPATHYVTDEASRARALVTIRAEMLSQLSVFEKEGKVLEQERLERRTLMDLEMIKNVGFCHGIENYSRHFDGRAEGQKATTLIDYFPDDFLTIVDESHVTIPQIRGMYAGDRARKESLVTYGFRLPSAKDNRPLTFEEYEALVHQTIFTSATPNEYEYEQDKHPIEMIVRPTGLVDPVVIVRPVTPLNGEDGQVDDLRKRISERIQKHERVLVTTLTKKMAEDLTDFLNERLGTTQKPVAVYIHSDVKTIERLTILEKFRRGEYDVLVGVNLLREGLDLPEVTLVAILDADKEGFLRSETAIIQTMGRAARNVDGMVVLYADIMTGSISRAIAETDRRRKLQIAYNIKHSITPQTIIKAIKSMSEEFGLTDKDAAIQKRKIMESALKLELAPLDTTDISLVIKEKTKDMKEAAKNLEFELATILRDEIKELERQTRVKISKK